MTRVCCETKLKVRLLEFDRRRAGVKGQTRSYSYGFESAHAQTAKIVDKWRASVLELSEVLIGSGGSRTVARVT